MVDQRTKKKTLLAPLNEAEYRAASVPNPEQIRRALRQGAKKVRKAAEQPRSKKVDPSIRFRYGRSSEDVGPSRASPPSPKAAGAELRRGRGSPRWAWRNQGA